jgi:alpha/beta superfamily hydrolase
VKQQTIQFGHLARLSGILSLPDSSQSPAQVVILVSAGFMPTSGPYRVYYEFADALASKGIATFRFDLGGIGNSLQVHAHLTLDERTHRDIRLAVDCIRERHANAHIILAGICSGAEDSFRYAEQDERVNGLILIDPHAFRTWQWWIHRVLSRHFVNRVILRLVRMFKRIPTQTESTGDATDIQLIDYQYTPKDAVMRILGLLLQRQFFIHYIYTGGKIDDFNHTAQLRRMLHPLPLNDKVSVDYLPTLEHTQMLAQDRSLLSDVVSRKAQEFFNRLRQPLGE